MKNLMFEGCEVIARKRTKLADGSVGWTGVVRAAYAVNKTVVGVGEDWIDVPRAYQVGTAGSTTERAYAKLVTARAINYAQED